ncbi:aspartyl protease family protein [uncultured Sphingomonas sp.]|uniref:aspartyl protease family protein n=1 Tax=uncultured Sphingomonas sp. TaxID=158754 RepID=UPI0035CC108F
MKWWSKAASAMSLVAAVSVSASGAGAAQTVLPLEIVNGDVEALPVSVDGHPGLYLFDSGIGTSAVTPAAARTIGCTPWGKITGFRAIGERVDTERCNAATIQLGAVTRRVPQLSVLDLEKLMGPVGRRFAGAIGLDAFDGETVTLSVAGHSLTVEDARSAARIAATGQEVPIRLVREAEGAALTADIGLATRSGRLWMEIDTGNYGPSLIDKRAAPLIGLAVADGRQPLDVAATARARLGGTAIVRDLIMDGDLGRQALKDWDVTLDLTHGRGGIRPATARPRS